MDCLMKSVSVTVCWMIFLISLTNGTASDILSTYAGVTPAGYAGDGGPATSAKLHVPNYPWTDSNGNLFFSDKTNVRIRTIDPSGIINLYLGTGTTTYAGDEAPATSTGINYLAGSMGDSAGNVYVCNSDYIQLGMVYKVSGVTNKISIFAGGNSGGIATSAPDEGAPATSLSLSKVYTVSVDSVGNVYIMDTGLHKIKKVSAATGIVHVIAGTGSAGSIREISTTDGDNGPATSAVLANPFIGSFIDTDLYITGGATTAVRKISLTTGIISGVAGGIGGAYAYTGDGGPATAASLRSSSNTYLTTDGVSLVYISFSEYYHVRKVDTSTGIIDSFAGQDRKSGSTGDGGPATAGKLTYPGGVAVYNGVVYITDEVQSVIRAVGSDSTSHTPTDLPTISPSSSVPSITPSESPSMSPTVEPSLLPSKCPSAFPTVLPSLTSSARPSLLPSVYPSLMPSACPSVSSSESPTIALSLNPTRLPTMAPTILPSAMQGVSLCPSVCPTSLKPSARPTFKPSIRPSRAGASTFPTLLPTVSPTTPIAAITFNSGIYLYNVSTPSLDGTSQSAVTSSVASTLNISSNQVVYVSQQLVSSSRRRLVDAQGYDILMTVNIAASTQDFVDTVHQNGSYLYHKLIQTLVEAVDSDAFTVTLRETSTTLGAVALYHVGHVNVTVTDYTDVTPSSVTDQTDSGLTAGAIIGIVIGGVAALMLVFASFYFLVYRPRKRQRTVVVASTEMSPA